MPSKFYQILGSHRPTHVVTESTSNAASLLLPASRRESETYFSYHATPTSGKQSSRYDPENPHKDKLGTYDGVFVPTALNVLSILMFLRFGFILGQLGIICTIGLLLLSYLINLLTTLSISAISTNGTVRGGGAYYMISRCLGPEFGGSIGLVFFLGQVFNSGMNAIGIIEPILYNLGKADSEGVLFSVLPDGNELRFIYATIVLLFCFGIALVGSQTVSKAGNIMFFVLVSSIVSIPISTFFKHAFDDGRIAYTGPRWETFMGNLYPHFTKGAAGSLLKKKETFSNLFGVFFPATAGIFAGAGMSSELRKPSKSIPKGTLWGLLFTFLCYSVVVLFMSASIPRETLYREVQVIQSVSAVQWLIFLGELSTSLFSIIVGMVGAAYVLEAIAKDSIIFGLSLFCRKPVYSLVFTWVLTQLCLFSDVNKIASFITMTFLMTFIVMNLACFFLEIAAAPNFRPSFKYFDRYTAFSGAVLSVLAMIIVDGVIASALISAMMILFLIIHYCCPPKPWGDVSQSLIYHQVRKYLLRLKQDNIKYWRPQILLLVDNPRTSWNLIRFCNHLKKGGLYILGHVTVTSNFQKQYEELKKQKSAWCEIRDIAKIKAFIQVGTGPTLPWGVRNVFLGSGLGGMKPNITVVGFFDLYSRHKARTALDSKGLTSRHATDSNQLVVDIPDYKDPLPTDACKNEEKVKVTQWVQIIEDLSLMQSNIAIAHGFADIELPTGNENETKKKKVIDLYPIQMSATVDGTREWPAMISSNFDTYTLILQLGAILITVPEWKRTHLVRVVLFVEKDADRSAEIQRMTKLLQVLRIEAEVLVVSLDQFRFYNTIVNGDSISLDYVNMKLKDSQWWKDLVEARQTLFPKRRFSTTKPIETNAPYDKSHLHRYDTSKLQKLGVSFKMSSNMPQQPPTVSSTSDSDESGEIDSGKPSISCSQLSINQISKKLNKMHKTNNRCDTLREIKSTHSLKPVFSSNTIPKTRILEDGTGDKPTLVPIADEDLASESTRNEVLPDLSPCDSEESLVTAMKNVKFDDLPGIAQHLILNDVMKQVSRESGLIFSTLPIPPLGTHKDYDDSLQYVKDLDIWLDGLPPTMLINSQTMTVTTAL
ncbi:Vhc1p KNAG_0M00680 [Huiozyma naganishii CBS 8797]|uniref:Amino acid permease/ SLC12A domain-containing protein n=1 Tax=Huiozyma naganishii (strain ATCC MYA-139 / BCRC 22969 / CBS 8797 / KCTC 17520 / NBRC 10181 / NCYC 3082 / Yp74L-3) TaxID=1071383 RepID=J7SBB5_HUIN7|nr:hypothetical protein KNAG_0M00680 [Kazachstania naganishii CBS 8797]CCK72921.1 hypothetical protein KNAG_0M00680 [Kazachstania naganishii CBS 8797]